MIMIVCIFSEERHRHQNLYSESEKGSNDVMATTNDFDIPITVSYDYANLYGPPAVQYEWMKGRFIIEPYKEAVVNFTDTDYNKDTQTVQWALYTISDDNVDRRRRRLEKKTA